MSLIPDDLDEDFEPELPEDVPELDEEDDDFSELDAMLDEATAATAEEKALESARARLARISKFTETERVSAEKADLLATIRKLEEGRVWITVGAVALFHTQSCVVCGARHSFFQGWFQEQKHATDVNARRLLAGKPIERLPERKEEHFQGSVEACDGCIESQIAIDVATGVSRTL